MYRTQCRKTQTACSCSQSCRIRLTGRTRAAQTDYRLACALKRLLLGSGIKIQGFLAFKYHHLVFRCEMHTLRWLWRLVSSRKKGPGKAPFGSLLEIMSQMHGSHHLRRLSQTQKTSSEAVAHTLNKNVCPIKCVHGALMPGAAAPLVHREVNESQECTIDMWRGLWTTQYTLNAGWTKPRHLNPSL